jgi:hypothetical protein
MADCHALFIDLLTPKSPRGGLIEIHEVMKSRYAGFGGIKYKTSNEPILNNYE